MSTPGKKVCEGELQGRSSGSLAWRLARGEQGATSSDADKGHVWRVTPAEKESKIFHLVMVLSIFVFYVLLFFKMESFIAIQFL